MARQQSRNRYGEDLVRMEDLVRECEKLADRCHRYADEAVIPSTSAMFRTLAYAYDAQAQALESAIEQATYLDREGILSEFLNAHANAVQGQPGDKQVVWRWNAGTNTHRAILEDLISVGLGSMPGGGAEIFDPEVRRRIAPRKADAQTWLAVHRAAHGLGLRTNATMLYGHVESLEDRVDHLLRLRELQDETGGFVTFIPLAFQPWEAPAMKLPETTGFDDLKAIAVARLMLDNVPPFPTDDAIDVIEHPFDLRAREIRVEQQAGLLANQGLAAVGAQLLADSRAHAASIGFDQPDLIRLIRGKLRQPPGYDSRSIVFRIDQHRARKIIGDNWQRSRPRIGKH